MPKPNNSNCYNKQEYYLFDIFVLFHKGMDGKQLFEWLSNNFKSGIHIPHLCSWKKREHLRSTEHQVATTINLYISLQEIVWDMVWVDFKVQGPVV